MSNDNHPKRISIDWAKTPSGLRFFQIVEMFNGGKVPDDSHRRYEYLDELEHLTEVLGEQIPKRLTDLVSSAALNPPSSRTGWEIFGSRLFNIIRFSADHPLERPSIQNENGLLPVFTLQSKDIERATELCKLLRETIFSSDLFDEPHKRRLLNRVAAIEHELIQPEGKLDIIFGGIVDFGDALGKFGTKAKPMVDRMKDIAKIARGSSKEYEQIPAPEQRPALPPPDSSEETNEN